MKSAHPYIGNQLEGTLMTETTKKTLPAEGLFRCSPYFLKVIETVVPSSGAETMVSLAS